MQVGLSYTSIENARNNRDTEVADKSFNDVKNAARQIWNEMLGRIQVEGGTPEDKTKFYTGLYHALLGRGIANDINGQYIRHERSARSLWTKTEFPSIPITILTGCGAVSGTSPKYGH